MTLVEACEFRRNFLHLRPREAVILNVEADHFDCYPTRDALLAAFCDFAAALPHDGRLLIQARTQLAPREDARRAERDECLVRIAAAARCPVETFGDEVEADWQAADVDLGQVACPVDSAPAMKRQVGNLPHTSALGRYAFDLVHQGQRLGRVELAVPGRHNVGNAVAAAALAAGCGCPPAAVVAGLAGFRGLQRRLQRIGTAAGIDFWDDYAHHPTEIATTLQTIREVAPQSRVWCLFQPHQALRTARLLDELAWSLQNAERVLIAEIYRAREGPPRPGETTAADLAAKTREFGQEVYGSHAPAEIQQFLHTQLIPGDTLVVMGAGDIGRTAHGLLEWFRTHRAAG
jgi:UDP-N-acetylmuramate--alanine ligase